MKAYRLFFTLVLAASSFALAQTQTQNIESRRYDVNGNPVSAGSVSESKTESDGRTVRIEYGVDAMGQKIPLTSTEETKVEQNGKIVTQQIVRRFDRNGNPTSTERVLSEEQKLAGGVVEKKATVYRTDLNGNETLDEKSVSRSDGKTSSTNIEKRGLDGALALAEQQTSVTQKLPDGSKSQSSVFKRDSNGNMYEVVKEVHETHKQGNQTVDNTAKYVVQGDGRFALQEQTVTKATEHADGTVAKHIEVYGEQVPGLVNDSGRPVLKEIQTVQSQKAADGSIVETTKSQKAEVNENGRLTAPQVISETVTSSASSKKSN